jgi:hypothetical protein
MTLTIELTPEQEARLAAAAERSKIAPAEFVQNIIAEHLPPLLSEAERTRREQVMQELIAETERLGLYQ